LGEIIAELEYKIEHAPPGPQGAQGIPGSSGKLPLVKSWQSGTVFYEGDVVMHAGCAFQAQRDTAKPLEHSDWRCIAAAGQDGRSIRVRGTWDTAAAYQLTVLNDRERRIFEARRLADKPATLEALAGEFGISRERIRQIEVRAFQKVQKAATSAISSRERPVGKRTSMSAAA
jgi:hypothetical protein